MFLIPVKPFSEFQENGALFFEFMLNLIVPYTHESETTPSPTSEF